MEISKQQLTLARISGWTEHGSPCEIYVIDGENEDAIIHCGIQESFRSKQVVQILVFSSAAYERFTEKYQIQGKTVSVIDQRKH